MSSFKRFLFSYLCILLLPIFILSLVISYVILNFCKAQLIEQMMSALQQLDTVIEIQREQLDSYVVQTASDTALFSRNLETAGDMYNVKAKINLWNLSNGFVEDVSYYNTVLDKIYCHNAVYTIEDYLQWYLGKNYWITEEQIREIFNSDISHHWLGGTENDPILYFTSARVSAQEKNWLIFEISSSVLDIIIDNATLYGDESIGICLNDGTVLYTTDPSMEMQSVLDREDNEGEFHLNGQSVIYTRVQNMEMTYIAVIPKEAILAPLWKLWQMFYLGIFLIAILGGGTIFLMMRVNYRPIQTLEKTVLDAQVLDTPGKDAISNVSQAFQVVQEHNRRIVSQTNTLAKEKVIFRLLMGTYKTVFDFNRDASTLGLHLDEGYIYLVDVKNIGKDETDVCLKIAETICEKKKSRVLFLEIPEKQEVIFIFSGIPDSNEEKWLETVMSEKNLRVKAAISKVCEKTEQLLEAYNSLYVRELGMNKDAFAFSQELYNILSNAIAFEEPSRIQFALESMCTSLDNVNVPDVRTQLLYVLYLTRSKCENSLVSAKLDMLLKDIQNTRETDKEKAAWMLRMIGQTLCEYYSQSEAKEGSLCQEIESFLDANYTNMNLTVQNVAELFGLSLSNLSHYFKSHVGMTVSGYIENLRISKAKELLQVTDMGVAEISSTIGYAQSSTFIRAFKKNTGTSPSAWRSEMQQNK